MKRFAPVVLLGFGVTLAVVIGQRMSTEAMAVVIGVAVGIAASVPTSLLLVALLRRERRSYHDYAEPAVLPAWGGGPPALPVVGQPPNVIVIDPAQYAAQRYQMGYPQPPTADSNGGVRRLRVVGAEEEVL